MPTAPGQPDARTRFGAALRRRRAEIGISQEELARRAGLNRTYYGEVETGKRNIALLNIEKLSLALGVTPSTLFREYKGDPPDFYAADPDTYDAGQRGTVDAESVEN